MSANRKEAMAAAPLHSDEDDGSLILAEEEDRPFTAHLSAGDAHGSKGVNIGVVPGDDSHAWSSTLQVRSRVG